MFVANHKHTSLSFRTGVNDVWKLNADDMFNYFGKCVTISLRGSSGDLLEYDPLVFSGIIWWFTLIHWPNVQKSCSSIGFRNTSLTGLRTSRRGYFVRYSFVIS